MPSLRPLVLLIGDSVDRNAVVSSCAAWAGATSSAPLAVGSSAEVAPRGDFVVCDADWGVLEAVHSYGLQQSGPYHLNNSARWNGPLVDTAARLPAIAAALRRRRGRAPDVVVYQAALWTAKALADAAAAAASPSAPPAPPSASIMAWHRERLRDAAHNVAVLREHFGPDTALLLRTAPVSVGAVDSGYFTNLVELNAATRLLGAATCTGVLDWAAALQGLPDARVFIDYIHPRERFSVAFGEALKVLAFALLGGAPIDLAKLLLT